MIVCPKCGPLVTDYDLQTGHNCLHNLSVHAQRLQEEASWVRRKLALPEHTPLFTGGGTTLAGTLHVVCSHAHGYQTYIKAYKCNDKQGEIARLTVENARLLAACKEMLLLLEKEYGHGVKNGYFPEIKPVLERGRATVADAESTDTSASITRRTDD